MKNPWIKKNPLLSIWLSSANAVFGAARGRAIAEARQQMNTLMPKSAAGKKRKRKKNC